MKLHAASSLLSLLLALAVFTSKHLINATTKFTSAVTFEGVTFKLTYYDDGRRKPYKITFEEYGVPHWFLFEKSDILVRYIRVGAEKYGVYHRNRKAIEVIRRDATERMLLDDKDDNDKEDDDDVDVETSTGTSGSSHRQRRLYACVDCEATWEALCETRPHLGGVSSVCELVYFYDHPISKLGQQGINIMCDKFVGACGFFTSREACARQCEDDTLGETVKCCERSNRVEATAKSLRRIFALQSRRVGS